MGRLFGTDGVRGVANTDLTAELALALGSAAARRLGTSGEQRRLAVVGRDPRASGEMLEAAVIGLADGDGLTKPKAFIVLKAGRSATEAELQAHVKSQLAPYKYPRWIEFATELPKTATGKIQRFKLRQRG